MSVLAVLFTTAITTLALLMRVEMKGTERIENTLALQKLSNQFRLDAAGAHKAFVVKQKQKKSDHLNFEKGPDTLIVYSSDISGNFLRREVHQGDKIIAREEFKIPQVSLQFRIEQFLLQEIVSIELSLPAEPTHENHSVKQSVKHFRLEACVNHFEYLKNQKSQGQEQSK